MKSKFKSWFQWFLLAGIIASVGVAVANIVMGDWVRLVSSVLWAFVYVVMYLSWDTYATNIRKRWFPRRIKPSDNPMEVVIVDPEQDTLPLMFGLTEERCHEIVDRMNAYASKAGSDIPGTILEMSRACKHPNELMYMSFIMGSRIEASRDPLARIFASIKGG